jgi:hypothetical protein
LQGADLREAELQGADLREAGLWNIAATADTSFGLSDLRGAQFTGLTKEQVEQLLANLPAAMPERAKTDLRERLAVKPGAEPEKLPSQVNIKDGKILVTNADDAAWSHLDHARLTTDPADIDKALAALLANVAERPESAKTVALRVTQEEDKQRPLIKLLGCSLQDEAKVTLRADTIQALREATGDCPSPSQ